MYLPKKKLAFEFTTEEEWNLVSQQENKNKKGINGMIMNNIIEEIRSICLNKWKIGSGNGEVYCLIDTMECICRRNGIEEKTTYSTLVL